VERWFGGRIGGLRGPLGSRRRNRYLIVMSSWSPDCCLIERASLSSHTWCGLNVFFHGRHCRGSCFGCFAR